MFATPGAVSDDQRDTRGSATVSASAHDVRLGPLLEIATDPLRFQEHCERLNREQRGFINLLADWTKSPNRAVALVTGGPGTGKTFTVIETLRHLQLKGPQLKLAYTGRIARRIGGKTLHSALRLDWGADSLANRLQEELGKEDDVDSALLKSSDLRKEFRYYGEVPQVVVIDEISMIAFYLLYWVVKYFFDHARKSLLVVLIGDHSQLAPVGSTRNVFGTIEAFERAFGRVARVILTKSERFTPEYDLVIEDLRKLVERGKDDDELFDFLRSRFPVAERVDAKLLGVCRRALVHRNETVDAYNEFYIKSLPGKRLRLRPLTEDLKAVDTNDASYFDLKENCEVFVTRNTADLCNGTRLLFLNYDDLEDRLVCKDLETSRTVRVERDPRSRNFPVVPGFAGTVHKFQGDTVDERDVLFNFDGCRDANLIYTALSRVRDVDQILAVVF